MFIQENDKGTNDQSVSVPPTSAGSETPKLSKENTEMLEAAAAGRKVAEDDPERKHYLRELNKVPKHLWNAWKDGYNSIEGEL